METTVTCAGSFPCDDRPAMVKCDTQTRHTLRFTTRLMLLSLLRSHGTLGYLHGGDEEADLHVMGAANLQALLRRVSQSPGKTGRERAERDALTAGLQLLAEQQEQQEQAPERPLLPDLREPAYFDVEEEVIVVTHRGMFGRKCRKLVPERLLLAYVIDDVRFADGFVSAVTRARTHSNAYAEGRKYVAGVNRGEFIRRSDLPALQAAFRSRHPEDQRFARLWLRHSASQPLPGYSLSMCSSRVHGAS